ncbi:MAG: hypothetical protein ACL93V_03775 [Candidatus Electrothrix sp. YB6]
MWYIILFAAVGSWFAGAKGLVAGAFLGFAYHRIQEAFSAIERLNDRLNRSVDALQKKLASIPDQSKGNRSEKPEHAEKEIPSPPQTAEEHVPEQESVPSSTPLPEEPVPSSPPLPAAPVLQTADGIYIDTDNFFRNLAKQLHKTSTVVQTGIVVLLFGLVFLVRYAARNQQFTVETALMATIAVGIRER